MKRLFFSNRKKFEKKIKKYYKNSDRRYEETFQNEGEKEIWVVTNGHCYSLKEVCKVYVPIFF